MYPTSKVEGSRMCWLMNSIYGSSPRSPGFRAEEHLGSIQYQIYKSTYNNYNHLQLAYNQVQLLLGFTMQLWNRIINCNYPQALYVNCKCLQDSTILLSWLQVSVICAINCGIGKPRFSKLNLLMLTVTKRWSHMEGDGTQQKILHCSTMFYVIVDWAGSYVMERLVGHCRMFWKVTEDNEMRKKKIVQYGVMTWMLNQT